ncbi:hypothetical protein PACTADRAFT_22431, partial [Pachysolen tannophilus NRRL Y-2460]
YRGYKVTKPGELLDVLSIDEIDFEQFASKYVLAHRPCVIRGIIPNIQISKFKSDEIIDTLKYMQFLQVERKNKGGFGLGTSRCKMTLEELLTKFKKGDEGWYLTTQYAEDEPGDELETGPEDDDTGSEVRQVDESDNDSEEEEEEAGELFPSEITDGFSDTSSINMNDMHDDFEEDEEEENDENDDDDDPVIGFAGRNGLRISEARARIKELLQPPLVALAKSPAVLPIKTSLLDFLIPQQINLWMGLSKPTSKDGNENENGKFPIDESSSDLNLGRRVPGGGSSSGLHHDHADNLYIPIQGFKRFTLFSPSNCGDLYTVGDISRVYNSGVIDYKRNSNAPNWRHLRADGAIITEVARYKLQEESNKLTKIEKKELLDLITEEEEGEGEEEEEISDVSKDLDPPSFSRIPSALLHLDKVKDLETKRKIQEYAKEKFPKFLPISENKIVVDLKPGEMLYLPVGWFHEVTSFGKEDQDNKDNIHIALNYWFLPPDGKDLSKPYSDDYWSKDFERTTKSIELLQQG